MWNLFTKKKTLRDELEQALKARQQEIRAQQEAERNRKLDLEKELQSDIDVLYDSIKLYLFKCISTAKYPETPAFVYQTNFTLDDFYNHHEKVGIITNAVIKKLEQESIRSQVHWHNVCEFRIWW